MPRASKPLPLDPPRRSPRRRAAPAVETTQSRLGAFLGALAITPLSPFPRSPAAREHDPWRVAVLVGTLVSGICPLLPIQSTEGWSLTEQHFNSIRLCSVTLASIALYSSTHIPLWRTERAPLSHLGAQTHKPSDSVTYEELNEILSQLRMLLDSFARSEENRPADFVLVMKDPDMLRTTTIAISPL